MASGLAAPTSISRLRMPVFGLTLTYTDEGAHDGATIVMLHGVPGTVADFRYLVPAVSQYARVICVDLPGFGQSEGNLGVDHSPQGRARHVAQLLGQLGISRYFVLGHSFGGSVALQLAADHPKEVAGLILVASVGLRPHRALVVPQKALLRILGVARLPGLKWLFALLARGVYRRMGLPTRSVRSDDEFLVHGAVVGSLEFKALNDAIGRVRAPSLVAYARDDALVEPEIAEELHARLHNCELVTYLQGGHNIQKTHASDLAGHIRNLMFPTRSAAPPRSQS